jgi:hypothetical protein
MKCLDDLSIERAIFLRNSNPKSIHKDSPNGRRSFSYFWKHFPNREITYSILSIDTETI